MEIRLSPELAQIVESDVANGRYASVEEYVEEAVGLLHEREEWFAESSAEEKAKLEASWQEAQRGELMSLDDVRSEMESTKAAWMRQRLKA
jgi:antitoxin ParD1/3/4